MEPAIGVAALLFVRWWWRVAGLVATIGLVAGCDVGSIRRPAPAHTRRPPAAASASTRPVIAEVRRALVPVPIEFDLQKLTFVDSARGYALYTRCRGETCEASLIATVNGGRTWSVRRHPRPFATNQQMVVSNNGTVMLLADPYGWFLSRDGGITFRRTGPTRSPPDDYYTVAGRFQVWRSQREPNRVVEYVNGRRRDLPVQPPLAPPSDVEYDESGRLWVATLAEGARPAVALSRDKGRTWQRQEVPGSAGPFERVSLQTSAAINDVWLLAQTAYQGFPRLWRFDGTRWVEQRAADHPPRVLSVAALGTGALAVALPDGAGLVTPDGYRNTDWPLANANLRILSDGTLEGSGGPQGELVFLGLGHGIDRVWVQVTVEHGRPPR